MAKRNKINVSQITGLTPTQEQAATLLASGTSITEVADKLNVSRASLYIWQKQTTFQCYFNRCCNEARSTLMGGLYGLAQEALATIKDCLQSEDEKIKLKAAIWIADKIQSVEIREHTDIVAYLTDEATYAERYEEPYLHEEELKQKLEELGLQEPSLQSTLK